MRGLTEPLASLSFCAPIPTRPPGEEMMVKSPPSKPSSVRCCVTSDKLLSLSELQFPHYTRMSYGNPIPSPRRPFITSSRLFCVLLVVMYVQWFSPSSGASSAGTWAPGTGATSVVLCWLPGPRHSPRPPAGPWLGPGAQMDAWLGTRGETALRKDCVGVRADVRTPDTWEQNLKAHNVPRCLGVQGCLCGRRALGLNPASTTHGV